MDCWTSRDRDLVRFQTDYWKLNEAFNPVEFDPDVWADLASRAGMKYMALTTKHHDGFCMWDTATTDYRVTHPSCPMHTHPRANLVGETFEAFRQKGMAISCYFSKADWHTNSYWYAEPGRDLRRGGVTDVPLGPRRGANTVDDPVRWEQFVQFTHEQIRELMTDYGKIDTLWLDAGWVKDKEDIRMAEMVAMARELQPGLIVANRTVGDAFEDFVTPEHEIPEEPLGVPWESCLPLAANWKYHPRDAYRSSREVLVMLADIVSRGGNFLLGVGPDPLGRFPATAVERLEEIAGWMSLNASAIHGTVPIAPYQEGPVRYTQNADGSINAIVVGGGPVTLDALPPKGPIRRLDTGSIVDLATLEPEVLPVVLTYEVAG